MATVDAPPSEETIDDILATWPDEPTEIARTMIDQYGPPDEGAPSELLWRAPGPWKRAELYRDGVPHQFPKEHTDYLAQVIDYHVPPEKADALARFDGSVYVDRTNGELAAKCDSEAANTLAINLAHDIVTDARSVEEAREMYAETMVRVEMDAEPDYATELQFDLAEDRQRDPDESIVTDELKRRVQGSMDGGTRAEGE